MTSTDNAMNFFRTMKGAPQSVLSVLAYNGRPMSNRELQLWTGYHGDTIARAVHELMQMGWLTARTGVGPWWLVPGRAVPGFDAVPASRENPASAPEIPATTRENPANSARVFRVPSWFWILVGGWESSG